MDKIRVLVVEPNKMQGNDVLIDNSGNEIRGIIGGWMETWRPFGDENIIFIMNEEGKLLNLTPNRLLCHQSMDYVAGTFIVAAYDDEGEFISLTDEQVTLMQVHLKTLFTPILAGRP